MNLPQPGSLQHIALGDIQPSPTNPRKSFDSAALAELADSIRENGVIEPITVRPSGAPLLEDSGYPSYTIVTGERRWRASEVAGKTHIPALIADLDDDAAAQIQMVENLQRADLHPMEEAEGYAALYLRGLTVEDVAKKTGKTVAHVGRMLRLEHLSLAGRRLFLAGHLTLGHALLLARLTMEDQERAVRELIRAQGDYTKMRTLDVIDAKEKNRATNSYAKNSRLVDMTEGGLRDWIAQNVLLQLAKAPWSLEDPLLVPEAGPCTTCPKRTGSDPALFADLTVDADVCMDAVCFGTKQKAFVQVTTKAAEQAGAPVVKLAAKTGHQPLDPAKAGKKPLQHGQWVEAKPGSCKAVTTGILVEEAPRYSEVKAAPGALLTVCADQNCKVHKHTVDRPSPHRGSTSIQASAETKKKDYVKTEQPVREALIAAILAVAKPGITEVRECVLDALGNQAAICTAMGWAFKNSAQIWQANQAAEKVLREQAAGVDLETLGRLILLGDLEGQRKPNDWMADRPEKDRIRLWEVAARYGVDADAIAREVEASAIKAAEPIAPSKPAKTKLTKPTQAARKKAAAKKPGLTPEKRAQIAANMRQRWADATAKQKAKPDLKSVAAGERGGEAHA